MGYEVEVDMNIWKSKLLSKVTKHEHRVSPKEPNSVHGAGTAETQKSHLKLQEQVGAV